ncbi:MAG: hypothetical protein GYB68_00635 [Chloroflexi bacterium]|nr:hypothetical protein [Chloroflexota bacterium]
MQKLSIEYQLNGQRPGYAFQPPTDDFDEQTLKVIWRQAMPRGQGWGRNGFIGARSIKSFPVDGRSIALSRVTVTDQEDETGRKGIRAAEIMLLDHHAYEDHLEEAIDATAPDLRAKAQKLLTRYRWRRILEMARPNKKTPGQVIMTYPYQGPDDWGAIEALVMRLALSRRLSLIGRWGAVSSFTTLALDYRNEANIVVLPLQQADKFPRLSMIRLD